jgi:hypothetical protein
MLRKLRSFMTGLCPVCGFRQGVPSQRFGSNGMLKLIRVYSLECPSCNLPFRALVLHPQRIAHR